MTRLVSVVGGKHSGKTTVIRYLISDLKLRGYKVSSIKEMLNIQWVDLSGKDTWEHGKAGAEIVVATPLNETVFFVKRKLVLNEIMPFLSGFDYVILEGFEHETVARIVAAKDVKEAEKFSDSLTIAVSGLIAESEEEIRKVSNLKAPIFNCKFESAKIADLVEQKAFPLLPGVPHCGECGYRSCYEFAKAIVAGTEARRNCPLLMRDDVVLEVNGKMIPLKLFPRTIITNIVRGIVSSLKDIEEVREVKIIVRKDQTD